MCCDDPPPDFKLLGPPPKPPWLHYNLHCGHDGIVLQHEGQTGGAPNTGVTKIETEATDISRFTSNPAETTHPSASLRHTDLSTDVLSSTTTYQTNTTIHRRTTTFPAVESTVGNSSSSTPASSITVGNSSSSTPASSITATAFQQNTEEALFSNSTLTIVAFVLFSLAALFLVITLLVLWQRRRLMNKQQIEHKDVPDEYQYLYNYKVRGKMWRLPKITMILRPKSSRISKGNKNEVISKNESKISSDDIPMTECSPINDGKQEIFDMGYSAELQDLCMPPIQKPVYCKKSGNYHSENSEYDRAVTSLQRPYSSLERGSSTTSGISSDGEWKYQDEHPLHYLEQGTPYRVRRLKRKGQRSRHRRDDGELGDVEGSVECLAKHEKRNAAEKCNHKPHKHNTPALDPTKYFIHPKDDVIVHTKAPIPRSTVPKRSRHRTQQFIVKPPQASEDNLQDQEGTVEALKQRESLFQDSLSKTNSGEDCSTAPGTHRGKRKKKRKAACKRDKDTADLCAESYSAEAQDNMDNEIRESYA